VYSFCFSVVVKLALFHPVQVFFIQSGHFSSSLGQSRLFTMEGVIFQRDSSFPQSLAQTEKVQTINQSIQLDWGFHDREDPFIQLILVYGLVISRHNRRSELAVLGKIRDHVESLPPGGSLVQYIFIIY